MKRDKILLNVNNLGDIEKYEELGISNFLFALKDYSIGYTSFSFEEISKINGDVYVLVNRILTDEDIDNFLKLKIPTNIRGFVIEDIGLYYELKDSKYELINFQNHLNNNYMTVNYWLKLFDSLVVSTDITAEEICDIVNTSTKPLVINVLGYPMIMYSRRNLVTNYCKYYGKDIKKNLSVLEEISGNTFKLVDSPYGTSVFNGKISDYRELVNLLDYDKVKFYLINSEFMSFEEVRDAIGGKPLQNAYDGFLHKKTIYRVGGES